MQTCRRFFALLAAILAAAVLATGCSSKKAEPLPDAAQLVQQSVATTKGLKSAHLDIAINGKIEGLPLKTLTGDLTNVPKVGVEGKATITMGGSDLDAGVIVYDGTLYGAMSPNQWLDMGPAADVYDPSVILDPNSGLAGLLSSMTEAKAAGFETIDGVQTVQLTGKVGASAVNKLIPQLKAGGPLPATVWIEKDEPHQLVKAKLDQSEADNVTLTLSEWDKPVTVNKPAV